MTYSTNTIRARTSALIERDGFDGVLSFYQRRDSSITENDVRSWASGEAIPDDFNIQRSIARRGVSLTGQAVMTRDEQGRFQNQVTFSRSAFRQAYDDRINEGNQRRRENQQDFDSGRISREDFDSEELELDNEYDDEILAEQYYSLDEWYADLNDGFRDDWVAWEISMGYRSSEA